MPSAQPYNVVVKAWGGNWTSGDTEVDKLAKGALLTMAKSEDEAAAALIGPVFAPLMAVDGAPVTEVEINGDAAHFAGCKNPACKSGIVRVDGPDSTSCPSCGTDLAESL